MVDQITEDVQVGRSGVGSRDLDRGNETEVVCGRLFERLADPLDAVVVGQRQQLDAGRRGGGHHLARRQLAVGVQRMALEVERRARFAHRTGQPIQMSARRTPTHV